MNDIETARWALELGAEFPYDAPDNWRGTMECPRLLLIGRMLQPAVY